MKLISSKATKLDGKSLKIAIVISRFNDSIGNDLLNIAEKTLKKHGVHQVETIRVPGALEIPLTAKLIANKFDAIIALGVIIKGATSHFDYVCSETYSGLMSASLETETPIIFGVLTVKTKKQALDRIKKGKDYAEAAIEMALLRKKL